MIFVPQVGGGVKLPELSNPAGAEQILNGYQAINGEGNILTGTIPTQGAQTITPGRSVQTIAPGRYLSGTQTIAGDTNLSAGNIRSGVSIFGVAGTYAGKELKYHVYTIDSSDMSYDSNYLYLTLPSDFGQLAGLSYSGVWTNTLSTTDGCFTLAYPGDNQMASSSDIRNECTNSVFNMQAGRFVRQNDPFTITSGRMRWSGTRIWGSSMLEVAQLNASIVYIPA